MPRIDLTKDFMQMGNFNGFNIETDNDIDYDEKDLTLTNETRFIVVGKETLNEVLAYDTDKFKVYDDEFEMTIEYKIHWLYHFR